MTNGSGPATAVRASTFTKSIGVETHLAYNAPNGNPQSPYASLGTVESALAYLNPDGIGTGIGTIRDDTRAPSLELAALGQLGYKLDIYTAYSSPGNTTAWSVARALSSLVSARYVHLIEGPLEVDNAGWGLATTAGASYAAADGKTYTGWDAAAMMQRDLYAAFGSKVPVALFSLANPSDGAAHGPAAAAAASLGLSLTGIASSGNVHFYPHNGNAPSVEMPGVIAQETAYTPGIGFAITESGFNDLDQPGTSYEGTPYANGVYTLELILDAFRAGASLTDIYELFDANMGYTGGSAFEDHWGLFDADGTAKPAATDLRNMLTILGDPGATASTFAPGSLHYSVSGPLFSVSSMLLQQSNGTYNIIVWSDASIDTNGEPTAARTEQVTVNLGGQFQNIRVFDPTIGATAITSYAEASSVTLELSDRPLIIQVSQTAKSMGSVVNSDGYNTNTARVSGETITSTKGDHTIFLQGSRETLLVSGRGSGTGTNISGDNAVASGANEGRAGIVSGNSSKSTTGDIFETRAALPADWEGGTYLQTQPTATGNSSHDSMESEHVSGSSWAPVLTLWTRSGHTVSDFEQHPRVA